MKKNKKTKKMEFLRKHLKCFVSPYFIGTVVILAGLSAGLGALRAVYGQNPDIYGKGVVLVSAPKEVLPEPVFSSVDLSYNVGVYVYSKKKYVCNDYRNVLRPNYFSMRCKVAEGVWRGHMVKKIDVAGYSKLRVKANLGVNDYTDYFAECGHVGVNRADFTTLMVTSFDPEASFRWDCNHEVAEEKWSMCQVGKTDPGVLAHCGLPICSQNASCDFEADVTGQMAVYLLFSTNDAWMADIEGSLSNVEIFLIK